MEDYERLLLEHLGLIDQIVRGLARRHRLSPDEAAELRDAVRLKLIENDYDVLRRFERRCSLRTYLTTVVTRFFLDDRNARWGKWRPSVEAKRLGPVAVLLERLLTRDGVPFDQAVEILRTNHQVEETRDELWAMSERFPARASRHFVGEEALDQVPAQTGPDDVLQEKERAVRTAAIGAALAAAIAALGPQDRLILKLRFLDRFQVSQIARVLKLEAKPLYRRIEQVHRVLRRELEQRGFSGDDVVG